MTAGCQTQPEVTPKSSTTTNNNSNTTTKIKEDQQVSPCDPKHPAEQQHNSTLNGNSNNGTIPPKTPTSPLSPTTLSTADLDSDLESLKSKLKVKTSRAQNKLAQQLESDFLANDPFKMPTFKFLPKSISLCNDDSVFKENYTKFCDRNAILPPSHIQESTTHQEVSSTTSTSSSSTTTTVSEGTKVIVTKTTKSSKVAADGTKTVTVKKTIVKQKKVTEQQDQDASSKLKSQDGSSIQESSSSASAATVKRTKFRVNQMSSRDVPVAINSVAKRYLEQNRLFATETSTTVPKDDCVVKKLHTKNNHSHSQQTETETANNLKNTMKIRSLSVDWDSVEAVENRSMKSINSFLKRTSTSSASSAVKQIQAQIEASIHK